jgi:hypothetical protein
MTKEGRFDPARRLWGDTRRFGVAGRRETNTMRALSGSRLHDSDRPTRLARPF